MAYLSHKLVGRQRYWVYTITSRRKFVSMEQAKEESKKVVSESKKQAVKLREKVGA